jgi:hypothetical protein
MRLEEQLREAYQRAAGSAAVPAGAYDRFLRRRARNARRAAAVASLTLAAAVALAVTVPRLLADRSDVVSRPKGQAVSQPELGYELVVPSGWRVAHDSVRGLSLEPAAGTPGAAPPGLVPVPTTTPRTATVTTVWIPRGPLSRISVESTVLDPAAHPDNPNGDPGDRLLGSLGTGWTPIDGPYRSGRRADGRGFVLQGSPRDPGGQRYYLAWPYHRADGVRCPLALRYRVLVVTGWAATAELAGANQATLRQVLDGLRPIGNALAGGACGQPPGLPARLVRPAPRTPRPQPARRRAAGRGVGHDRGHGEPGRRRLHRHLLGRTLDQVPSARPVRRRAARGRPARGRAGQRRHRHG